MPPQAPCRTRPRRLAGVLAIPAAALLIAVGLLAALWRWSGTEGSLGTALRLLPPWLPAGQTLDTEGVTGSLRGGGRLARLRWSAGGLQVQAMDTTLAWDWRALRDGELHLERLAIGRLVVEDRREAKPTAPPDGLALPLRVRVRWQLDRLDWLGGAPLSLGQLDGSYIFDSNEHRLEAGVGQFLSGNARFQARLQARAPLTLTLQGSAVLATPLPGRAQALPLAFSVQGDGPLGGARPRLEVQARLAPTPGPAEPATAQATAELHATLAPWQPQALTALDARWRQLDLSALVPGQPHTRLAGRAQVLPSGDGWSATLQANNATPGPWDGQRLPLEQLKAEGQYDPRAGWVLRSLSAQAAGGTLTARGARKPTGAWTGDLQLRAIDPSRLHRRLAAGTLDGHVAAQADGAAGEGPVTLDLRLGGRSRAAAAPGLRLDEAVAHGRWHRGTLVLDALRVRAGEARLEGRLIAVPQRAEVEGRLELALPGADVRAEGTLAAATGEGQLRVHLADAAVTRRWLIASPFAAQLPMPDTLDLRGAGQLDVRWHGGWAARGQGLQLVVDGQLPVLAGAPGGNSPWTLADTRVRASGTLAALALEGEARLGDGSAQPGWLRLRAGAGWAADGLWRGRIEAASWTPVVSGDGWSARLLAPLAWQWQDTPAGPSVLLGAGSLRLTGPSPGEVRLDWAPLSTMAAAGGRRWQVAGTLQGLPLGWLEAVALPGTAGSGLRGDLQFGGDWSLQSDGGTLQARARVARERGDLALQTEDAVNPTVVAAGVREASLTLDAEGPELRARLRWSSERAGEAEATLRTRLSPGPQGWHWPTTAPLAGELRASLPRLGAWSALAPPGWRVRGTLQAAARLSGTRAGPQWQGQLQADDLAVRAGAEGMAFRDGRLRAELQGQRLVVTELSLRGAGNPATAGRLSARGEAGWPTGAGLRVRLDARADALRVSERADRRLTVSGPLQAHLDGRRLTLRGALRADQALFVLPEDTAPRLGEDVRIRGGPPNGARPDPGPGATTVPPDVDLQLDLGPDFQVRGMGLSTRLAGTLTLRQEPAAGASPRLRGELHTVRGSYRAYGQQLDIETGRLRFDGPYDNPVLEVLAIRPHLAQRVGVAISGTAQAPRVRLYADPDLPEPDKLAWLVLGRAAASGGAESAVLQQAALALVGGKGTSLPTRVAESLGLDEFSLRGAAGAGTAADSAGTAAGATVTLGKRLSRDFYLAYERSLSGALGTVYIVYELSRRLTLRAQTGEHSAVDLVYTRRYD